MLSWILAADLEDRIDAARALLLSEVRLVAARDESIVSRGDAILSGMALRQEVEEDAPVEVCQQFLTARVEREPVFDEAAVLDQGGSVRCSSFPAPSWTVDPDGAFFRQMVQTEDTVVGDVMIESGAPLVLLGRALRDDLDRITGLSVLAVSRAWLQSETAETFLPPGGRVSLIDDNSQILARFPDEEALAGQRLPDSRIIRTVLANPEPGTFEEENVSGERRIVAHAPILTSAQGSTYHLLISVPRQAVVGKTQIRAAESFGILLLVLLLVISVLIYGADRMLLAPLARLSEASLRLERGDLTARSGLPHGRDEIGRLAHRFDLSAAAIERREAELIEKVALLHNANDAIIVRDTSNRITFWNKAAEALYGWTEAEAIGQPFQTLLMVDSERYKLGEEAVRETGRWVGEIEKRTKSGRTLTVSGSWTLLKDKAGVPLSILTIDSDITERRIAHEKLRESEERFRSLTESISEIFWMIDAERTRCLYVSPAFETIMGRRCQDLYDTPGIWADAIHPEDRERVLKAVEADQFLGTYNETYRIIHADGSVRWLHERAFPVRDADGRVQRIAGTAADVTFSRQMEEQLQQSQKMEAIGRLAGGIAHDFNNLLVIIMGYTDILLGRSDLDEDALSALRPISRAADRASALTTQLLGFSRKSVLQPRVIDLNAAVRELGDMLTRLIGEDITLSN